MSGLPCGLAAIDAYHAEIRYFVMRGILFLNSVGGIDLLTE
jgi:hypothetical protein